MTNNAPSQQSPTINHGRHTKTHHNEPQRVFSCDIKAGDTIRFRTRSDKHMRTALVIRKQEATNVMPEIFHIAVEGYGKELKPLTRRKDGKTNEFLWNVGMRIGDTERPWVVDAIEVVQPKA